MVLSASRSERNVSTTSPIRTSSPAWAEQLRLMMPPLRAAIDGQVGAGVVRVVQIVRVEPAVRGDGAAPFGLVADQLQIAAERGLAVTVGDRAAVVRTHGSESVIGAGATVGPFTYLRPGTQLGADGKLGAFVEVKNSVIGTATKVPHLTYVGDADIGEHSNIGASSVFVNYDGETKRRTTVGSHVRTGSDTLFVAPVQVGDGAYTAAGSVITDNVPAGAMAVARSRQRIIAGWVQRRRAGSASARAAQAAGDSAPAAQPPDSDQHGDPVTSEESE